MEAANSGFDNAAKQLLEELFGMSTGYVMDFNNGTFASFIQTCVGFDPYDRYDGSKAAILRQIWLNEPFADVAKLNLDLLQRWRINKLRAGQQPTEFESYALTKLTKLFTVDAAPALSPEDLAFLGKDLAAIDLAALPKELTAQKVIQARLDEIDRALDADAPLAVLFLVGSTLEGLLAEFALAHTSTFTSSPAAPRLKGSVKPLATWTLSELITVSHVLGVLGEDVAKHAEQVRTSVTTSTLASSSRRTLSRVPRPRASPSRCFVRPLRTCGPWPTDAARACETCGQPPVNNDSQPPGASTRAVTAWVLPRAVILVASVAPEGAASDE